VRFTIKIFTTDGTTFNVSVYQKLAGGVMFFREPAKSVTVKYAYKDGINGSNLFTGLMPIDTLTSLGDVPSGNGEVLGFGFSFRIRHVGYAPSLLTFYVRFIFVVNIGTYYLKNDGGVYEWTTDSSNRVRIFDTLETEDAYNTNRIEGVGFITADLPASDEAFISWDYDLVDSVGDPVVEDLAVGTAMMQALGFAPASYTEQLRRNAVNLHQRLSGVQFG